MRTMVAQSLVWGACFIAGLIAPIKSSRAANCALYARAETGVALYGAAGGWWDEADGHYERGHAPAPGAILVFKRTRQIPSGHVAVVAQIISAHEILVDHANWYRGTVSRGMSVIDTSLDHDWTSVAVINPPSGTHGRDYPTYGFVYPRPGLREIVEIRDRGGLDSDVVNEPSRTSLVHLAVATETWHGAITTHRHHRPKGAAAHSVHDPAERAKLPSPAHASHAGTARPRIYPVRTTETKHHRA
jgi:surface antigen